MGTKKESFIFNHGMDSLLADKDMMRREKSYYHNQQQVRPMTSLIIFTMYMSTPFSPMDFLLAEKDML